MRDDSDPALPGLEEIRTEAAGELPILAGLREATRSDDTPRRIPRATPRYSGRTAAQAQVEIHEPPAPPDPDSSLSFTLEGDGPPRFAPYTWAPGWNSDESLHRFQHEIPGAVESAEPGLRLFDEQPLGELPDYPRPPDAYSPEQQRWLLLPLQEVFGSDELSALSPPVAELIPAAYLTLNPADAQRLGLDPQRPPLLELELQNGNRQTPLALPLQARLNDDWPAGTVGLPLGLPGLTGIRLPTWALIRPRAAAQPPESAA
jgi:NADH-quinone oxidoreductase subunit G